MNNTPSANIPNGQLVAPEYEILNGVTANELANWVRIVARGNGTTVAHGSARYTLINNQYTSTIENKIKLNQTNENAIAADAVSLVDNLDILLCGGGLNNETKTTIATKIDELIVPSFFDSKVYRRAKAAIIGIVMSPGCAVQ